jgi:hypothetical protein
MELEWINKHHPTVLKAAVVLLYANAGFVLYTGLFAQRPNPWAIIDALLYVAAGLAISTEQKGGYALGLVLSGINLVILLLAFWRARVAPWDVDQPGFWILVGLQVAPFLLLLHPDSRRRYQAWWN